MNHHLKTTPSSCDLHVIGEGPWDSAAWHPSLPPFTRNVFLSPQSPRVQILLLFSCSVQVPLPHCSHFWTPLPTSGYQLALPWCLMTSGLLCYSECLSCCAWRYSYLCSHPRPYLLIPTLKTWILIIIVFQIRPGTVNTQCLWNQCPNDKVNNNKKNPNSPLHIYKKYSYTSSKLILRTNSCERNYYNPILQMRKK